jgi:hypothetical protein
MEPLEALLIKYFEITNDVFESFKIHNRCYINIGNYASIESRRWNLSDDDELNIAFNDFQNEKEFISLMESPNNKDLFIDLSIKDIKHMILKKILEKV